MISCLKNLLTISLLGLAACAGKHTDPKPPVAKQADTVVAEPPPAENFSEQGADHGIAVDHP